MNVVLYIVTTALHAIRLRLRDINRDTYELLVIPCSRLTIDRRSDA